jgi:hypothetical protein
MLPLLSAKSHSVALPQDLPECEFKGSGVAPPAGLVAVWRNKQEVLDFSVDIPWNAFEVAY